MRRLWARAVRWMAIAAFSTVASATCTTPIIERGAPDDDAAEGLGAKEMCSRYVACVAETNAEQLPAALDAYGIDGDCWQGGTSVAESCGVTCQRELVQLRATNPSTDSCIACDQDAHCADEASHCVDGNCVECVAEDECGGRLCQDNRCVGCVDDSHCDTACVDDECVTCPTGSSWCADPDFGSGCVDHATDVLNCGGCGIRCNDGECREGSCATWTSCLVPDGTCDQICASQGRACATACSSGTPGKFAAASCATGPVTFNPDSCQFDHSGSNSNVRCCCLAP